MNKSPNSLNSQPESWGKLLGPVVCATDLPEGLRATSGLIVLKTHDNTEMCPHFQFDKDENGKSRVNPHIGLAWSLLTALNVDQLGESRWTVAGMLAQPRPELDGLNWADALKSPDIDDVSKMPIFAQIVGDAVYAAGWLGDPLIDPRTLLGK